MVHGSVLAIIGGQWGDEGKGKVIDECIERLGIKLNVRFQGGRNAGHTVKIGEQRYALHLVPSGILHPGTFCVIGNGCVADPIGLVEEIEGLQQRGVEISPERLKLSDRAHIVLPYHIARDKSRDKGRKVGTTGRGIGPTYEDKAARTGLRFCDTRSPAFAAQLRVEINERNWQRGFLTWLLGKFRIHSTTTAVLTATGKLRPYIADTANYLQQRIAQGDSVLLEGAQGTLLDIDHGTYPYVTSSNTTIGGALAGSGLSEVDEVIGVVKAYTTRVGGGPFPTRMDPALEEKIRQAGKEFGTTTGRPRNCGWLDVPALRYAIRLNGFTSIALTKLDVLAGLSELKICVGYTLRGVRIETLPASAAEVEALAPIYETLGGFGELQGRTSYHQLPEGAKRYHQRLEGLLGVPITIISTGPARHETIYHAKPAA